MKIPYPVPKKWRISSRYGVRKDPKTKKLKTHYGYDFATPIGTAVYAVMSGVVFKSGYQDPHNPKKGFGLRLWQRTLVNGKVYNIFYAHLSTVCLTPNGLIQKGQIIGRTGDTGKSSGPHLHFEIRPEDSKGIPLEFIEEEKFTCPRKPSILRRLKEHFCRCLSKRRS